MEDRTVLDLQPFEAQDRVNKVPSRRSDGLSWELQGALRGVAPMPVNWIESVDVSNAVLFLASDEARDVDGDRAPRRPRMPVK